MISTGEASRRPTWYTDISQRQHSHKGQDGNNGRFMGITWKQSKFSIRVPVFSINNIEAWYRHRTLETGSNIKSSKTLWGQD